jgi:WXG100 family type VII secretion target
VTQEDDGISVDFGTMNDLSSELEAILKDLTQRLDELYARVKPVVAGWEGEARDMCVASLDRWDRAVSDMHGAQAWLHDVVVTGHLNYTAAHRAVLRGWGGA